MNKVEMTEIFSVMMLAWPNADMFKGGIQKLGPTVAAWTISLSDVTPWVANRAVLKLYREADYPPSPAKFRKAVDDVLSEMRSEIRAAFSQIRTGEMYYGSLEAYYTALRPESRIKTVIDSMGGPDTLVITGKKVERWNLQGFEDAYWSLLSDEQISLNAREQPAIAKAARPRKELT